MKKIVSLNVVMENAMKEMKENEKFVIADIPMEYLAIAPNQRDRISKSGVDNKAKKWDTNKCFILKGTWHFGDKKVLLQDGQHRYLAAKKAVEEYGKEINTLKVAVFIGLTPDEEIDLFLYQDEGVNKLRYCDKFKSIKMKSKRNEVEQAMFDLMELCDKYDILLSGYNDRFVKSQKKIGSIKKSYEIIQYQGKDCFEWIIDILHKSGKENSVGAWNGCFLKTLASFYNKDLSEFYKKSLIEILKYVRTIKELCPDSRGNEALYRQSILELMNNI